MFWLKRFYFGKTCLKQRFSPKWLQFRKSCSRLSVLTKMALFFAKPAQDCIFTPKWFYFGKSAQNSGFVQNNSVLAKARQNCVVWPKWLYFGESRWKTTALAKMLSFRRGSSKLCVLAKIALFWQNLLETVCLGQKWLYFAKNWSKPWFWPK